MRFPLPTSLVSLALITAASAQDEIVVTATKLQVPVNEIGANVTIIDGDILSESDSGEDLATYVAGLQAAVANGNQVSFQIRGIGAVDHQALTPTAAAVYVDGVFQATNVQTGPLLFDVARAEVLRGPQGTLYGRNATAGAINFTSVKPGQDRTGYVTAELGDFDRVNINAAATLPANDKLSFRLAGRYLTQGPLLENVVTDENVIAPAEAGGERDEFGLRLISVYTPDDMTEMTFNVHYAEDNGINPAPRNEGLDLDDHQISVGPDGIQQTDNAFGGGSIEVKTQFGEFDFYSLSAVESYSQNYGFDFAALPGFFGGQTANLAYDRNFSQTSQEFRLSKDGKRGSSLLGVYLEQEKFDQEYLVWCGALDQNTLVGSCNYIAASRRVGANPTPDGASASTLQSLIDQDRTTAALFTFHAKEITERLNITAGLRLTHETIEGSGEGRHIFDDGTTGLNNQLETDANGNPIIVGEAKGENEIEETRLNGQLGLTYELSDAALAFLSFSNGYKSGGFNGEVINNASHFDDEGLFGAETVNTGEIGIKFTRGNNNASATAFYNAYNDPQARFFQQVTLENGDVIGLNSLSNFDSAESFGLDLTASTSPIEGLDFHISSTFLKTEIQDTDQPSLNGDALPFAPEISVVAGVSYDWPINENMDASIAMNGKYQSEFSTGADTQAASAFQQDGYGTIDARAQLTFANGSEIGLWGRNLTNEDYAVSAYRFFGPTTFRGAPRTMGISFGYRY